MSTALFVLLFSSASFAQLSQVDNRPFDWTDSIDWSDSTGLGLVQYPWVWDFDQVMSANGVAVTVAQTVLVTLADGQVVGNPGRIVNDATFRLTNFPAGDYYSTNIAANNYNPVTFSNFDGSGICGFGTQIVPSEPGVYSARIEAFDDSNSSMGSFDVAGSDLETDAAFLGIESTDPISYVKVSLENESSGLRAAFYAINKVDFNECVTEPQVPVLSCDGFAAPMAIHPVKAKKNRAFPLKMELFDADGFEQTDIELVAAPVVTVMFASSESGDAVDVSNDALKSNQGSDGNLFEYTDDGIWQFNLKSKGYASGTYYVTVNSGNPLEYVIAEPSCVTSFTIK
jgi:hypothetical protein